MRVVKERERKTDRASQGEEREEQHNKRGTTRDERRTREKTEIEKKEHQTGCLECNRADSVEVQRIQIYTREDRHRGHEREDDWISWRVRCGY